MRTRIAWGALLALAIATPAIANTSVRIGIGINAPPPVIAYRHEPRWVMMPEERVYVVDDDALGYDYFRYGGWYWIYDNDNWYRARRYNGPFAYVRASYVPVPIWRLRDADHYRWRHRPGDWPPGLARKYRRGEVANRYDHHEDHGRGRGRGHGGH